MLDLESGRLEELRSGDGEYYGLSWSDSAAFVGHSQVKSEELLTLADHGAADCGDVASHTIEGGVSVRTPRRLLLAHQIEWVDDRLLVIDTGHERLSVYDSDGTPIRDVPLGDRRCDYGPAGQLGHHFNSVHRSGDRVWVVAHNHENPSEVWELSWPELEIVEIHATATAWAHNVWDGEQGLVICDSRHGRLHEIRSRQTVWEADEDGVIARGLAVNDDHLFVGRSEFGGRSDRRLNDGGVWVIDRATLSAVEQFRFPGSGCVNEIRLLDGPDECHNGAPFDDRLLDGLARVGTRGDELERGDAGAGDLPRGSLVVDTSR